MFWHRNRKTRKPSMHAISFSCRLFVSVEGNDLISLWTVFVPEDHSLDLGKKKPSSSEAAHVFHMLSEFWYL